MKTINTIGWVINNITFGIAQISIMVQWRRRLGIYGRRARITEFWNRRYRTNLRWGWRAKFWRLSIRFRVDGVLREVLTPSRKLAPLLVSRVKVMAKLDIAGNWRAAWPRGAPVRIRGFVQSTRDPGETGDHVLEAVPLQPGTLRHAVRLPL